MAGHPIAVFYLLVTGQLAGSGCAGSFWKYFRQRIWGFATLIVMFVDPWLGSLGRFGRYDRS